MWLETPRTFHQPLRTASALCRNETWDPASINDGFGHRTSTNTISASPRIRHAFEITLTFLLPTRKTTPRYTFLRQEKLGHHAFWNNIACCALLWQTVMICLRWNIQYRFLVRDQCYSDIHFGILNAFTQIFAMLSFGWTIVDFPFIAW